MIRKDDKPPALEVEVLRKLLPCPCVFCAQDTTWLKSMARSEEYIYYCDGCGLKQVFDGKYFVHRLGSHATPLRRAWGLQQMVVHAESYERRTSYLGSMAGDASAVVRAALVSLASVGALDSRESIWVLRAGLDDAEPEVATVASNFARQVQATQKELGDVVPAEVRYEAAVYRLVPTAMTRQALHDDIMRQEEPWRAVLALLWVIRASGDPWWVVPMVDAQNGKDALEATYPTLVHLAGSSKALDALLVARLMASGPHPAGALRVLARFGGPSAIPMLRVRRRATQSVALERSIRNAIEAIEHRHERGGALTISSEGGGGLSVTDPDES